MEDAKRFQEGAGFQEGAFEGKKKTWLRKKFRSSGSERKNVGGASPRFGFSHSTQVSDILNDEIILYTHPALATGVTERGHTTTQAATNALSSRSRSVGHGGVSAYGTWKKNSRSEGQTIESKQKP